MQTHHRPLLFLDVDGPLNPTATCAPEGYSIHLTRPAARPRPLAVYLNPTHGAALRKLPYDLVWATTWHEDANTWISPPLGLPALPYVELPCEGSHRTPADGLWISFKTEAIANYADGRPFAWIDDEITALDKRWVREHYGPPALLHAVNPFAGLHPEDFSTLAAWARNPHHNPKD